MGKWSNTEYNENNLVIKYKKMNPFSDYLFFSPDTFGWPTETTTCDTKEIGITNGLFYNKKVKATESAGSGYVTEMIKRKDVFDSPIRSVMEKTSPMFPKFDDIVSTSANSEGNKRPLFSNHENCNKSGNIDISIETKLNEPDAQIENSTKVLHTVKKYFQCNQCDKRYKRKWDLEEHSRVHTGEKPFKCNVCEKSFGYAFSLKIHTRAHTGEKPYKCELCDKGFAQSAGLKRHASTHSSARPFKCGVCKESFSEARGLKLHTRIHDGVRPYKCQLCDKSYIQKSGLIDHNRRLHSSEKPFKCEVCEISYAIKNDLTKHQKSKRHLQTLAELSST
ncbi:C2H2-type zinc finger protein [Endozoicomonas sp. ALE010]|uniref:C2H2-type zinc finger protein n=1 Tax=Endozoicomonas sp. ALE010 TaxID=3403081 RepID=UPI003BB777B0